MVTVKNPGILIVEDELITAESISELLQDEDYSIIGIARDAATAVRICNTSNRIPDVVICDINIKGSINGIELAMKLKKRYGSEIVFLTAMSGAAILQTAFAAEPVMYLIKPYTDKQLLIALQMAVHRLIQRKNEKQPASLQLTERELEIARFVAEGLSSKQIAGRLNISIETVKKHRSNMLLKNNLSNFPQLIYLMHKQEK